MFQDHQSKSIHAQSLSGAPEPQEVFENQSPARIDPFQALASTRLNKNIFKLRPVDVKKSSLDSGNYPGSSNNVEDKRRRIINLAMDAALPLEIPTTPERQIGTGDANKRGSSIQTRSMNKRERTSDGTTPSKGAEKTALPLLKPTVSFLTPVSTRKDSKLKVNSFKMATSSLDEQMIKVWPATTTNANLTRPIDIPPKEVKSALKPTPKYRGAEEIKTTKLQPESMPELRDQSIPAFEPFKRLVFAPNVDDQNIIKHASLVTRGLNYSMKLLKPPPLSYINSKQVSVKELKPNQKTLVLDLDETLVHCCQNNETPDVILPLVGDPSLKVKLKIRPFAKEFLMRMKEHFEIIVFTASTNLYAETVVRELDPDNKYISYLLDRPFCLETKSGYYIKDLRILKNRDLKNMIIVDNLVHSFGFQIDNGIPILDWRGDKNDQELKYMMNYLLEAKTYDDMRVYNRERLNLTELSLYKVGEVRQQEH